MKTIKSIKKEKKEIFKINNVIQPNESKTLDIILDKNRDAIDKFLAEHPEYKISLYPPPPTDAQANVEQIEARASKGDLTKLVDLMGEATKFVRNTDFKKILEGDKIDIINSDVLDFFNLLHEYSGVLMQTGEGD